MNIIIRLIEEFFTRHAFIFVHIYLCKKSHFVLGSEEVNVTFAKKQSPRLSVDLKDLNK